MAPLLHPLPTPPAGLRFSGAVFAGGQSRRMGRDKPSILVNGERLLDRQLRLLSEAGAEQRLLVLATGALPGGLPDDVRVVRDEPVGAGPLAGLAAALAAATHPLLLALAVDLPQLNAGILRQLLDAASAGVGVAPRLGGGFEPLAALYPRIALAAAVRRLAQGRRDLQGLISEGVSAGWMRAWEVPPGQAGAFLNWNSPADWPAPPGESR